jgi:hypothetical protein
VCNNAAVLAALGVRPQLCALVSSQDQRGFFAKSGKCGKLDKCGSSSLWKITFLEKLREFEFEPLTIKNIKNSTTTTLAWHVLFLASCTTAVLCTAN